MNNDMELQLYVDMDCEDFWALIDLQGLNRDPLTRRGIFYKTGLNSFVMQIEDHGRFIRVYPFRHRVHLNYRITARDILLPWGDLKEIFPSMY